jgi:UDP-2,3-diacylglucosamine pyrophosphatase LpxH
MIIFVGDVHGKYNKLMELIKRYGISDSYLIALGDFGVGFYNDTHYNTIFNEMNIELDRCNNKIYVLRGNHDNPSYFPSGFGNIKFVEDYTCIQIEGKKILFLGGACSIDRNERKVNEDYWLDEKFNLEIEKLKTIKCDIVVSHSAPSVCYPYTNLGLLEKCKFDQILYSDITEERKELNIALEILMKNNNITNWYYGHFHHNHVDTINNIRFECLDELNFSILD